MNTINHIDNVKYFRKWIKSILDMIYLISLCKMIAQIYYHHVVLCNCGADVLNVNINASATNESKVLLLQNHRKRSWDMEGISDVLLWKVVVKAAVSERVLHYFKIQKYLYLSTYTTFLIAIPCSISNSLHFIHVQYSIMLPAILNTCLGTNFMLTTMMHRSI